MNHKHLMIDIETLDTVETAVVLSIAAVWFDLDSGEIEEPHYRQRISIQSNLNNGRTISEDTLKWWLKQDREALNNEFAGVIAIGLALNRFHTFISVNEWKPEFDFSDVKVWSNSPQFDLSIMKHLYRQAGYTWPFKYYNERDVRTFIDDYPPAIMHIGNDSAHDPLEDCRYQVRCICAVKEAKKRAFTMLGDFCEEEQ